MSSLPATTTAIEIREPGDADRLHPVQRPMPLPATGEVLIAVEAAGINRPDVLQRKGEYPPPAGASDIPGLEVAGRIVSVGLGVNRFKIGDAVCALVTGGGYASFALAAAPLCLPVPQGFSMVEAAACPETFFTVWHNLFERGRLVAGESVLIHGGTSGIGTTAIMLARAFGARPIFATAGSPHKCRVCGDLGATQAIDYKHDDFVKAVKDATAGRGVDVVLDMVGGDYIQRNLSALAPDGRLVFIAFLGGAQASVNFISVMLKRLTITGSTLRARQVEEKGAIAAALHRQVWPLLDAGKVRPVIHKTFPLAEAAAAHRLMESSEHIGKIVLTI